MNGNSSDFQVALFDKELSVNADLDVTGDQLVIAFGGIKGGLGIPTFEFFNFTKGFNVKKILIRDLLQSWYHQGLHEVGPDIHAVVEYLRAVISDYDVKNVMCIGNSMGGYAAILFGALLDVDVVHAFSPQTFIDKQNRLLHFDLRWRNQIRKTHLAESASKEYFDLRSALQELSYNTDINIHYSAYNPLDMLHARRMRNIFNVTLHSYPYIGHTLVRALRDSGQLEKVMGNFTQRTSSFYL